MNRIKKILSRKIVWFLIILFAFIYFNNCAFLAKHRTGKPLLLAHRGLAQTFNMEGITNETNTAQRINKPEYPYLENTIPSMEAAFQYGADIVELDIQLTKDGQFAVFHDWTLEYRTNGKGVIKDYTMSELKQFDVGYNYTADDGKTFPFRGKGVGLMPSLDDVLNYFPEESLLIHIKSDDPQDGEQLAQYLSKLKRLNQLTVYGGDKPIAVFHKRLPGVRAMSAATLKKGLLSYMAIGWTGYIPSSCKNTEFHIPLKYAPILWGWPNRFLNRMESVNTRIIVVGGEGEFSEGFDTVEDIRNLPSGYTGGIWTNRIDRIAPLYNN
ncbi:putative glycerophosphoryl diester phosphodiesterase 1 [Oxobacter pfennigii]|uniref:Putative glycerophosphoryl diester phosphodiesterase 1 n=1 Tax=Oxobacter pfennigii TaxID=36849 RepID=A0A0P8Z052_9CLOT|nr:glycerophosphodiester phosphodiesterase family protein [Oxobacter pfennigii]KPU45514.1 putative glycerophosphoryl diester phosphodiesterase 1 [Oxobacter pfennigii]